MLKKWNPRGHLRSTFCSGPKFTERPGYQEAQSKGQTQIMNLPPSSRGNPTPVIFRPYASWLPVAVFQWILKSTPDRSDPTNVSTLKNATLSHALLRPWSRPEEKLALPACPKARWLPISILRYRNDAIHFPFNAAARLPSTSMATPAHASLWSRSRH